MLKDKEACIRVCTVLTQGAVCQMGNRMYIFVDTATHTRGNTRCTCNDQMGVFSCSGSLGKIAIKVSNTVAATRHDIRTMKINVRPTRGLQKAKVGHYDVNFTSTYYYYGCVQSNY